MAKKASVQNMQNALIALEPHILLVTTLVGLGITTTQQIIALWKQSGMDDQTLATIQVEADKRLAQWKAM